MQSQSGISKRQTKKHDTKDRWQKTKELFCKFGPKHVPRLKKAARQAVEDRPLATIPHNATITHADIPNPNYVAESDIPRYAAIRPPNCVSGNEAQRLLDQVRELKDAKMPFNTTKAHGDTFL
ncbi:hypothetical protein BDW02DRAFT_593690 [Decorospora gaudefroyi]|uniref:Uncharacterized protein n=1 Tax=Decorospora gaudefroyi TaxID=184978 RepID=A0A6A5KT27_9PLEO|nr:hypothetical protein BDW02DRAFT_593690 [Decorospora gaudefroyi]